MAFHSIVFGVIHPLLGELFGLEVKQGCVKAPFVILSVSKGQENVSYEILRCALNDKNNVKRGCVNRHTLTPFYAFDFWVYLV